MERGTINRENLLYNSKPAQKKNRAARNKARRDVAKSRGTTPTAMNGDVAHKKALSKGGGKTLLNLFLESKGGNRSFSRNADSSLKSEVSKREKKKK